MSAIGAVTGNGVYSELDYNGRRFKVAQWYADAMDAVSTAAFLRAARVVQIMGGNEKEIAQREVALARSFSLGAFEFDAVVTDDGMEVPELLAVFLHRLLKVHDANVTYELAVEMCKADKAAVQKAVSNANPQNGQRKDKAGTTAPSSMPAAGREERAGAGGPAGVEVVRNNDESPSPGNLSENLGSPLSQ